MFARPAFFHAMASGLEVGKAVVGVTLLVMFAVTALPLRAAPPSASTGKAISGKCAACHGNDGMAVATRYPNLAGQNYQYLLQQLEAFKNGKRKNPIMHSNAARLSKQQMKALAAYYASLDGKQCASGESKPNDHN